MKILHVETGRHLYGGPQQVLYLVSALAARGVRGVLACPRGSDIDTAARAAGIAVRNLACAGDLDLAFAIRLKRLIGFERPDLVHCHSRRGADLMGGLAARLAGVPAVVSRRVDNREPALLAQLRYRPFERVIAISDAVSAALSAQGVDAGRVVRIRSAVDTAAPDTAPDCARFRREFGLPDDALVIAAAGQLIPRKGHRFLVAAFARLVKTRPRARLLIFGSGPLLGSLQRQVRELGLENRVGLPGFRDDLDGALSCIDILAHPALAEGLGVVVLKAAAAGVPVVATTAGGLPEAVVDGETGLLVPAQDDAALADALGRLAGDPVLRHRFGAAGRERMQKSFSVATMAENHETLYESLIDG